MPEWPEITEFQKQFREFVAERDWDQFHTPKNLAMALAGEVGELLEHFQWLSAEESQTLSKTRKAEVEQEIADVQIYLATLADRLEIEIGAAVERKMALNAKKYPARQVRGSARKYFDYE
jgi:NTP pyrophosphatase (non-canonical NTP hydrolase)